MKIETPDLANAIDQLVYLSHQNSVLHGFYDTPEDQHPGVKHMLMVTELAELFENFRRNKVNVPDEHCPDFTNEEIELADVIIRAFDYAGWRGLRLGQALVAKHNFNTDRPYKHGKTI